MKLPSRPVVFFRRSGRLFLRFWIPLNLWFVAAFTVIRHCTSSRTQDADGKKDSRHADIIALSDLDAPLVPSIFLRFRSVQLILSGILTARDYIFLVFEQSIFASKGLRHP